MDVGEVESVEWMYFLHRGCNAPHYHSIVGLVLYSKHLGARA